MNQTNATHNIKSEHIHKREDRLLAKIHLPNSHFDKQICKVLERYEDSLLLATTQGQRKFNKAHVEIINVSRSTTKGHYEGTAAQMRQHWDKVGIDPSLLIAEMKENRAPEPEWNAEAYNPINRFMTEDAPWLKVNY